MLTLPDFKEKKIVFLIGGKDDLNSLHFQNCNLRLKKEGEFVDQISCHLISTVFLIGHCTITSMLIRKCKEFGISLFLLDDSMKCYAYILSEAEGNYKLREKQYLMNDDLSLTLQKNLVRNKIKNQYKLVKAQKYKFDKKILTSSLDKIYHAKSLQTLLGIEGNFAKNYFNSYFKQIDWYRRSPQTKEDIPNLLLDIGYTFLFNYVDSLLKLFGFDTYKGFYHQLFFERKSLSCDIMEPIRPIIDKQLVKSYNLNQIDQNDFVFQNGLFKFKQYKLSRKYTKIFSEMIMTHREEIYKYVLSNYRFIMDSEKYELPYFTFSTR